MLYMLLKKLGILLMFDAVSKHAGYLLLAYFVVQIFYIFAGFLLISSLCC